MPLAMRGLQPIASLLTLQPGLIVGYGGTGDQRVTCALSGDGGVGYSEVVRQLSGLVQA